MPIIETKGCQCVQCKHIWIPGEWRRCAPGDYPLPRWCPKCKSARWNEGGQVEQNVKRKVEPAKKQPIVRKASKRNNPAIEGLVEAGIVTRGMPAETVADPSPKMSRLEAMKIPKEGYCPHRKQKGEICYKCDEKWGKPLVKIGT